MVMTTWQKSLMRRAKSHVLRSSWSPWAYCEWEARWKEAHKSHVVQYPLSTTAEESGCSFWGSACRSKQGSRAFGLPCLWEGCWDRVCGAAPREKPGGVFSWGLSVAGLLSEAHSRGLVSPVALLVPVFPLPGSFDSPSTCAWPLWRPDVGKHRRKSGCTSNLTA